MKSARSALVPALVAALAAALLPALLGALRGPAGPAAAAASTGAGSTGAAHTTSLEVLDETIVIVPDGEGGWRALDTVTFTNTGQESATSADLVVPGDARDLARADGAAGSPGSPGSAGATPGARPELATGTLLPGGNLPARVALRLDPGASGTVSISWRWRAGRDFEWVRPVLYPTGNFTALAPGRDVRLSGVGLFPRPAQTVAGRALVAMGARDVAQGSLLTLRARPPGWWRAHPAWAAGLGAAALAAAIALPRVARRAGRP